MAESSNYDHICNGYYFRITAKKYSDSHQNKHLFAPKPLLNIRIYHLECLLYLNSLAGVVHFISLGYYTEL